MPTILLQYNCPPHEIVLHSTKYISPIYRCNYYFNKKCFMNELVVAYQKLYCKRTLSQCIFLFTCIFQYNGTGH